MTNTRLGSPTLRRRAAAVLALIVALSGPARAGSRLYVFATDAAGTAVEDLAAADVDVKEDGASCRITAMRHGTEAMRVVLLVDNSDAATSARTALHRGLHALVEQIPANAEVGLVTVSGGYALKVAPATDRARLSASIDALNGSGGPTQIARALMDTRARLLQDRDDRWPVYVIVAADTSENTLAIKQVEFDAFSDSLQPSAATVHAVLIGGAGNSQSKRIVDALATNLTRNTGGLLQEVTADRALPDALAAIGARIADDARRMSAGYEIDYVGRSASANHALEVGTARPGVTLRPALRRVP